MFTMRNIATVLEWITSAILNYYSYLKNYVYVFTKNKKKYRLPEQESCDFGAFRSY